MNSKGSIPYGRQDISEEDIDAVVQVLRSDFLTQGPAVIEFDQALAQTCHVPHAVSVANGTAALHLACLALEIGANSLVWTSPITFVASANCARYLGAKIDFVDIDPETGNICVNALEEKLRVAKRNNRLPSLLIPIHFSGRVCDMPRIFALSRQYGFKILEDACHALGAQYRTGAPVGACTYSDATVFSFHPVKSITTAEGGAITTQDASLAETLNVLRTHGITKNKTSLANKNLPEWYYEQQLLGFNYRLTDIQAALGRSQLSRLPAFIARRLALAQRYRELLQHAPLKLPNPDTLSAWHLYVVNFKKIDARESQRDCVYSALRAKGIATQVHYYPVHLQPYYRALGFSLGDFPQAEAFSDSALSLPLYPTLSEKDQDFVVQALLEIIS